MRPRLNLKSVLLIILGVAALIFLLFPLSQPKVLGRETKNACSGMAGFGFRKVRYATVTPPTNWEGLAHYETWCLFWYDLRPNFQAQPENQLTQVDNQKIYFQKLSDYLGNWTYTEVIPHDRWNVYANDAEIGFIQNCGVTPDGSCIHNVPQTYGAAQIVSKYRLDKTVIVQEAKYDVAKSANLSNGDAETIVRQDAGFVFTFDSNPTQMLLVIYDDNLGSLQAFHSRLQDKEFSTMCDMAQTTLEIHNCAFQELQQAEADLKTTLSVIQTFTPKSLLNTSQSSWQKYRDDYCLLLGQQYEGGSFQPVMINSCLTDLTRERIRELEKLRGPY